MVVKGEYGARMGRGLRIVVAVGVGFVVLAIAGQLMGPVSVVLALTAAGIAWALTKPRATN